MLGSGLDVRSGEARRHPSSRFPVSAAANGTAHSTQSFCRFHLLLESYNAKCQLAEQHNTVQDRTTFGCRPGKWLVILSVFSLGSYSVTLVLGQPEALCLKSWTVARCVDGKNIIKNPIFHLYRRKLLDEGSKCLHAFICR